MRERLRDVVWFFDEHPGWTFFGFMAAIIVGLVLCINFALGEVAEDQENWATHCKTDLGGTYQRVALTKGDIEFCLTDDGRILEVR